MKIVKFTRQGTHEVERQATLRKAFDSLGHVLSNFQIRLDAQDVSSDEHTSIRAVLCDIEVLAFGIEPPAGSDFELPSS